MTIGEFDIIARYFTRATPRPDILLGVGDDAAIVRVPEDRSLVVAMDTIVEGVHFLSSAAPRDVGYRVVAVNLSDLAAMGATPAWMTLSLSLPAAAPQWLEEFAAGLFELADRHDVQLIGGDTVKGPLVATVQIAGYIPSGQTLLRSGARPGDRLYVSGVLGEAAAGLHLLQRRPPAPLDHPLVRRFLRPEPRMELGSRLLGVANAAMDISDGLVTDLSKLCAASGVGARVLLERLPRSEFLMQEFGAEQARAFALGGGDDYELLFTVPADRERQLREQCERLDVQLTQIGEITGGLGVECLDHGRVVKIAQPGFDHFRAAPDS